jgi:hypothetical protein
MQKQKEPENAAWPRSDFPALVNTKMSESNHLDRHPNRKVTTILVYWSKLVKYRLC